MSAHISLEKRLFGRRPTYVHGWVRIPGRPALPCVIRNLAEGGALLMFNQVHTLPYAFLLDIDGMEGTRGCEIRHLYDQRVGVEFVDLALVQQSAPCVTHEGHGAWLPLVPAAHR